MVKNLGSVVEESTAVQGVLQGMHPDTELFIVRYRTVEEYSSEAFTHDVYFNEVEADEAIRQMAPSRSRGDTFYLLSVTAGQLRTGIHDPQTESFLNPDEIQVLCDCIKKRSLSETPA